MDGVCHLEQGPLGQPWTGAPRVVQKPFMMWTLNMFLGVLGHQGMGLARWPLRAWMEFAIWSRDLGHPRTCAPKPCGAKSRLWCGHQSWFRGPRAPRDGSREVGPSPNTHVTILKFLDQF